MSMNNARVIQCESFDIECFEGNGRIEKVTTLETPQIQIGHLNSKFLEIYEKSYWKKFLHLLLRNN